MRWASLTDMETHWSSDPDGNLMINFDPVFSSVSLRGRNLQMTRMESSLESPSFDKSLSLSSPILTWFSLWWLLDSRIDWGYITLHRVCKTYKMNNMCPKLEQEQKDKRLVDLGTQLIWNTYFWLVCRDCMKCCVKYRHTYMVHISHTLILATHLHCSLQKYQSNVCMAPIHWTITKTTHRQSHQPSQAQTTPPSPGLHPQFTPWPPSSSPRKCVTVCRVLRGVQWPPC